MTPCGDRDSPASDPAANYDYQRASREEPELVGELEARIDGEVRFDDYTRQLYATDASAYEVPPVGVVFPTSTADVSAVVSYCAAETIPVLPRGGGTSLAGQAVNEAVVLDFSRFMDGVVEISIEEQLARGQAGAVLADLNSQLAPHGLKFAPDPAWGDKSTLGGAIGNNSTGAHSLVYGKTDAYVESCEVVLSDGTVTEFGEVSVQTLHERADETGDLEAQIYAAVAEILDTEAEEIETEYPDLERNVSGYNLDRLLEDAQDGAVNIGRLLAGSEGTLAIVTEASVSLETVPETRAATLLTYDSLLDAARDVSNVLEHDPAAVEVMDDVLLELARETEEFQDVVSLLPDGTDSVLLVEFYADSTQQGKAAVESLLADLVPDETGDESRSSQFAVDALTAYDETRRKRFWKLRKSGLPILLGRTSDAKHIAFIEDTAVPPETLPAFVEGFQSILDDHDTFASYYAHAGPGVLHIRPLINTKTTEGVETMHAIADEATDLVAELGGSVSGEHGDGRARSQWNRKLYGESLWETFRELKTAFDPDWLLNPGQVCGDVDMRENLRFDPEYDFEAGFEATLEWQNENGFQGMVELCHGCGGCRGGQETTGSVMCPTYRADNEEILSTRGRANSLRQAMSGNLNEEDARSEEFLEEVLDLCIGCKGCARDCPSEVDMAKLKAELTHQHHQEHGASLRDRVFKHVPTLFKLGQATTPVSNWVQALPGASVFREKLLGIARERGGLTFAAQSLEAWAAERTPQVDPETAQHHVLLFPDTYTNYSHPAPGKAAIRVLEAAGVSVELAPSTVGSGRAAYSKGFLDTARQRATQNIDALTPHVKSGSEVVVVEPSDAVMIQSDYVDLLDSESARTLATHTYGICEYLDSQDLSVPTTDPDETLTYHGHCHQKATRKDGHAVHVLREAGYDVDRLDSTCCGMAGSFGYEVEHYSMSNAIGSILFEQVEESPGERVVASGTSCRTQLADGVGGRPTHPIESVAETLSTP